jgi:hypothetical protein
MREKGFPSLSFKFTYRYLVPYGNILNDPDTPSHSPKMGSRVQMEPKMRENRNGGGGEIPFKESRKIIKGNKT